jgi:hypothetical protein
MEIDTKNKLRKFLLKKGLLNEDDEDIEEIIDSFDRNFNISNKKRESKNTIINKDRPNISGNINVESVNENSENTILHKKENGKKNKSEDININVESVNA